MPVPNKNRNVDYAGDYMNAGRIAESAAQSLLTQVFPAREIRDVRDDPEYQKQDVDFIVVDPAWEKRCEVKYDRHVGRGNFCFEVVRIRHNTEWEQAIYTGWSIRTNTHVIMIWDEAHQTMYIVYHWALVQGVQRYCASDAFMSVGAVPTDAKRTTVNIYVPHKYVSHHKYVLIGGVWELQAEQPPLNEY